MNLENTVLSEPSVQQEFFPWENIFNEFHRRTKEINIALCHGENTLSVVNKLKEEKTMLLMQYRASLYVNSLAGAYRHCCSKDKTLYQCYQCIGNYLFKAACFEAPLTPKDEETAKCLLQRARVLAAASAAGRDTQSDKKRLLKLCRQYVNLDKRSGSEYTEGEGAAFTNSLVLMQERVKVYQQ